MYHWCATTMQSMWQAKKWSVKSSVRYAPVKLTEDDSQMYIARRHRMGLSINHRDTVNLQSKNSPNKNSRGLFFAKMTKTAPIEPQETCHKKSRGLWKQLIFCVCSSFSSICHFCHFVFFLFLPCEALKIVAKTLILSLALRTSTWAWPLTENLSRRDKVKPI